MKCICKELPRILLEIAGDMMMDEMAISSNNGFKETNEQKILETIRIKFAKLAGKIEDELNKEENN